MASAYQELGHLHRDSGNEQQAIAYYRQATVNHNPALLASWKILYNYFDKTQNKASAKYSLDKIKDLEALPKVLYINQILHEGNIKEAEFKCRQFLKKNPTNTHAMSLLSDIAS